MSDIDEAWADPETRAILDGRPAPELRRRAAARQRQVEAAETRDREMETSTLDVGHGVPGLDRARRALG